MLRLLIIIPFLAVLVVFLLFNVTPVPMSFIMIEWSVSPGIFAFLVGIVSFVIGALVVFISLVKQWRRARKAEQNFRNLEDQLNQLRAQYIALTQQPLSPHTASSVAQQIASANTLLETTGEEDISK